MLIFGVIACPSPNPVAKGRAQNLPKIIYSLNFTQLFTKITLTFLPKNLSLPIFVRRLLLIEEMK